jgi:hypothetical protein
MVRAYSLDLRECVAAAVGCGESCRWVGRRFKGKCYERGEVVARFRLNGSAGQAAGWEHRRAIARPTIRLSSESAVLRASHGRLRRVPIRPE